MIDDSHIQHTNPLMIQWSAVCSAVLNQRDRCCWKSHSLVRVINGTCSLMKVVSLMKREKHRIIDDSKLAYSTFGEYESMSDRSTRSNQWSGHLLKLEWEMSNRWVLHRTSIHWWYTKKAESEIWKSNEWVDTHWWRWRCGSLQQSVQWMIQPSPINEVYTCWSWSDKWVINEFSIKQRCIDDIQ